MPAARRKVRRYGSMLTGATDRARNGRARRLNAAGTDAERSRLACGRRLLIAGGAYPLWVQLAPFIA